MKEIRTDVTKLYRTQEIVASVYQEIREVVQGMRQDIQELHTMWEGSAHDTYTEKINRVLNGLEEANRGIRQLADLEIYAASEYERCFREVESMIDAVKL